MLHEGELMGTPNPACQRNVTAAPAGNAFSAGERDAVYKCIFTRRDVRGQFRPDPVPDEVLARLLLAAHRAPSVGFMQPWDFVVIGDGAVKRRVHAAFLRAHESAAREFDDDRARRYRAMKLEGILEAPINLCVTCDRSRSGPVVIGRSQQRDMDLYSAVCAVQNLWLAARAEGVGVGWVSIIERDDLRAALGIPAAIEPIAYLASAMSATSRTGRSWKAPAGCRALPWSRWSRSTAGAARWAANRCWPSFAASARRARRSPAHRNGATACQGVTYAAPTREEGMGVADFPLARRLSGGYSLRSVVAAGSSISRHEGRISGGPVRQRP